MSRSVIENQMDDEMVVIDGMSGSTSDARPSNKSRLSQTRDLIDVLGPLPAIPSPNVDNDSRWSIRRVSGYSGIYEEILDPASSG